MTRRWQLIGDDAVVVSAAVGADQNDASKMLQSSALYEETMTIPAEQPSRLLFADHEGFDLIPGAFEDAPLVGLHWRNDF